jgi:ABC-2 type transport system ATP-binding protein
MSSASAYEVRSLRKVYERPRVVANDGISFAAEVGESFGLLGPNGSGKTTLVRQLVGLLVPSAGEVRLFGEVVRADDSQGRRIGGAVAYLPQGPIGFGELRVGEVIRWTGMLRGLGKASARAETDELLEVLQLGALGDRPIRKLSGGQRRLVQIGMSFVGRLPVLILDEPTVDIDPALRRRIWELISARARAGACVILVTHDVAEAEGVLDRVAILDAGRVVATGTPAELKSNLAHRTRIELVVAESAGVSARTLAAEIGGETRVNGRHVSAWVPAELALPALEKAMAAVPAGSLEDVRLITPTLEDVYLELRGHPLEEVRE